MSDETLLFFGEVMLAHDPGAGHPESPRRLRAIHDELLRSPVPGTRWVDARPAGRTQIERIHTPAYLDLLEGLRGRYGVLDPDTATSPDSIAAAYLAAGCAIQAADEVVAGRAASAFVFARPPGHHAEADRAMGFCLVNNVAAAAAHAVAELGCRRVLVVDWDVHHGNGTQNAFYERRDILFFSTHQHPLYPGTGRVEQTGRGEGAGFTVNVPLPPGMEDADYLAALREILLPAAEGFRPDLVLVSAGFDAHCDDPLAGMRVTEDGFSAMCGVVKEIADQFAAGRLVLVLEGGYDLPALTRSVRACLSVMRGAPAAQITTPPSAQVLAAISAARAKPA